MTERYKSSAIPYMQRLLNESERKKIKILRQIDKLSVPVDNDTLYAPHHWEDKNFYYNFDNGSELIFIKW